MALKKEAAARKDATTTCEMQHRHFAFIAQTIAAMPEFTLGGIAMNAQVTQEVSTLLDDMGRRVRARRLPLGLIVRIGTKEYSFASIEARDSFIERATYQGLKPEIVKE